MKELRSSKLDFRCAPSEKERWEQAARKAGYREYADFYRATLDEKADLLLGVNGQAGNAAPAGREGKAATPQGGTT